MQPGNLVRVVRASLGVPKGTLALIIKTLHAGDRASQALFEVQILPNKARNMMYIRRYYAQDLKIVNASR